MQLNPTNPQHIENLTELEFEMLCYLYEHRGQVCTKDDLIENVYRQQYDRMVGGVDDARLQTLISRLREKIEPDRQSGLATSSPSGVGGTNSSNRVRVRPRSARCSQVLAGTYRFAPISSVFDGKYKERYGQMMI